MLDIAGGVLIAVVVLAALPFLLAGAAYLARFALYVFAVAIGTNWLVMPAMGVSGFEGLIGITAGLAVLIPICLWLLRRIFDPLPSS